MDASSDASQHQCLHGEPRAGENALHCTVHLKDTAEFPINLTNPKRSTNPLSHTSFTALNGGHWYGITTTHQSFRRHHCSARSIAQRSAKVTWKNRGKKDFPEPALNAHSTRVYAPRHPLGQPCFAVIPPFLLLDHTPEYDTAIYSTQAQKPFQQTNKPIHQISPTAMVPETPPLHGCMGRYMLSFWLTWCNVRKLAGSVADPDGISRA